MYQSGAIVWSPASGAHASTGAIRSKWQSAGFENGKLGYATSDEVGGLKNAGVYQMYQGGAIVWTPATGPHISTGYIRTLYGNAGFENGVLGYPTSDEYPIGGSGVAQDYQGGVIVVSNSGGYIVSGAIGAEYKNNPAMGYPTSSEAGIKDGGKYQLFQSGAVIWSPTTGAHASLGGTRAAWASTGFENGTLGYPTTDEVPVPGGVYQKYQGGVIYWSPSTSGKFMTTDYQPSSTVQTA
ncbi:protein PS1 [Arthrobacter sp. Hiyo6]|nr:protein PS1 [Arthrobacter sp. Hiyo6]